MHEGNFTTQIVEAIMKALVDEPQGKPAKIKVKVGEMLHLIPESVQTHFKVLTEGTRLEGVALDLEEVPVRIECLKCQKKGAVEDHHLLICQFCESMDVKLVEGDGVEIAPFKLEEAK